MHPVSLQVSLEYTVEVLQPSEVTQEIGPKRPKTVANLKFQF